MSIKKTKFKQRFGEWLSENFSVCAGFLLPLVILLGAYIIFEVYPFGEMSVLGLDLNAQYNFYFAYMKDVLAGNESILYSWSRSLSGEFLGTVGYYLASPFNFIVWAFPLEHITEGLLCMIITKAAFAGLLMSLFLRKYRHRSHTAVIVFSTLYALTSYNIEQTLNPMWLDGVMILPAVIAGIERFLDRGRFKMLILSLVYAFVTCFYIGYMIGLFTGIYFVYYMFSGRTFNRNTFCKMLVRAPLFLLCTAIATAMSAFMLGPVVNSLSLGKFAFSDPDYTLRKSFDVLRTFAKFLPNSYDTVRMSGLPFLYCGIITAVLAPVWFTLKDVALRRKIGGAALLLVMFMSMYIMPVDMIWHGGQMPNWLPYRYSFIICFLLLDFASVSFDSLKELRHKHIAVPAVVFLGVCLWLDSQNFFDQSLANGAGRDLLEGTTVIAPAVILLFLTAAVMLAFKDKFAGHVAAPVALIVLVTGESLYNSYFSIDKQRTDVGYTKRDTYTDVIIPTREKVEEIRAADPSFYRMEKNFFRSINDPMAVNMYGVTHSSSVLNAKAIEFLHQLGYTGRSHATRYTGATPLTDDILGFKYILSCPDNNAFAIKSKDDIIVEENTDVMPLVYLAETKVDDVVFTDDAVFDNQSKLLRAMVGEDVNAGGAPAASSYYDRVQTGVPILENLAYERVADGYDRYTKINPNAAAALTWSFTMNRDGKLFMHLPSKYERVCSLKVNGKPLGEYYETDNYNIRYLGTFRRGEHVDAQLILQKDKVFFYDSLFEVLSEQRLRDDIAVLHAINENTNVEALTRTHLRVTCKSGREQTLFTTMPYEPGWTVRIDGNVLPADEQFLIAGALLAVRVPPGAHTVDLTFMPPGLISGAIVSLSALAVLLIMVRVDYVIQFRGLVKARKKLEESVEQFEAAESEVAEPKEIETEEITEKIETKEITEKIETKEITEKITTEVKIEKEEKIEPEKIITEVKTEVINDRIKDEINYERNRFGREKTSKLNTLNPKPPEKLSEVPEVPEVPKEAKPKGIKLSPPKTRQKPPPPKQTDAKPNRTYHMELRHDDIGKT